MVNDSIQKLRATMMALFNQRTEKNALWLVLDRVIRMTGGTLLSIWLARSLGPSDFGVLNYVLAFWSLFAILATLGADEIFVRELVHLQNGSSTADDSKILRTAFLIRIFSSLSVILIAAFAAGWSEGFGSPNFWLILILSFSVLGTPFGVIELWFQSKAEFKYPVIAKLISFAFAILLRAWFIWNHFPLIAYVLTWAIETCLSSIALYFVFKAKGGKFILGGMDLGLAKRILGESWPLLTSSLMISLYMRIDQVMLGRLSSTREVGLYSAAVTLTEIWNFLPIAIFNAMLPSIFSSQKLGTAIDFERKLDRLYGILALLGYTIAILTTLFASPFIRIIFGPSFIEAVPQLQLLIWSLIFVSLGVARSAYILTNGLTKLHLASTTLGCFINIALNLILIPQMGGMGAVIATVIAYAFASVIFCFCLGQLRHEGRRMLNALLRPWNWIFQS